MHFCTAYLKIKNSPINEKNQDNLTAPTPQFLDFLLFIRELLLIFYRLMVGGIILNFRNTLKNRIILFSATNVQH